MMKHTLEKTVVILLAMVLVSASLNAAKKTAAVAPDNKINPKDLSDASVSASLDKKSNGRVKRAHHLAEKSANTEFLNSPQGIAFKKQLTTVDDEINDVYEKYLNIFHEGSNTEKGKNLYAERDRQIKLLKQKREKAEADYEKLKETSPVYLAMAEKHLKSELGQLKGKLKAKPSEEKEDNP